MTTKFSIISQVLITKQLKEQKFNVFLTIFFCRGWVGGVEQTDFYIFFFNIY